MSSSEPGWTVREDDAHLIISGLLSSLLFYHEDQLDPDDDGLFLHILLILLVRMLLVAPLHCPLLILGLVHGPWPGPFPEDAVLHFTILPLFNLLEWSLQVVICIMGELSREDD